MDDDDRRSDLFSFDIFTSHWDKMIALGDVPSPRSGARGVAFNDMLYFFGGYSKQSSEYYEDLFRYDLNRKRWEALPDIGEKPSKRTDHSMVLYGNSLYVFGGYDG
jgi:leucine-zipper-like transcriptional regulator 1